MAGRGNIGLGLVAGMLMSCAKNTPAAPPGAQTATQPPAPVMMFASPRDRGTSKDAAEALRRASSLWCTLKGSTQMWDAETGAYKPKPSEDFVYSFAAIDLSNGTATLTGNNGAAGVVVVGGGLDGLLFTEPRQINPPVTTHVLPNRLDDGSFFAVGVRPGYSPLGGAPFVTFLIGSCRPTS